MSLLTCDNIVKILKFQIKPKMATELKTNGTAAEYSPNKTEQISQQNGSNGEERYTKRRDQDAEGDEETVPLRAAVDVEKSVPVATMDEDNDDQVDTNDGVSLSGRKSKKKTKKEKKDSGSEKRPLKG